MVAIIGGEQNHSAPLGRRLLITKAGFCRKSIPREDGAAVRIAQSRTSRVQTSPDICDVDGARQCLQPPSY